MKKDQQVVIVGRKNAGKSTLFNRLVEEERSITSKVPGTTRDSNHAICNWRDKSFQLIDTGGLDIVKTDSTEQKVIKRTQRSLKQADVILYLVDGRQGLKETDRKAFNQIKKDYPAKLILTVNKLDSKKLIDQHLNEFWRLGAKEVAAVSATSGIGTGDLLDKICNLLTGQQAQKTVDPEIKIATVGKPNVGKSSLINTLLAFDRLIISNTPGTTRDAQYIPFKYQGKQFLIIDTAGIRKKSQVGKRKDVPRAIEIESVRKSLKAIKQCQVALLILDISEKISSQDKRLARTIVNEKKGLVLVANKWDLIKNKDEKTHNFYKDYVLHNLPFLTWAPLIFVSATEGIRVKKILQIVQKIRQDQVRTFSQEELTEFINLILARRPPGRSKGKKPIKILALEQDRRKSLKFDLKIGSGQYLPESYKSFIMNMFRVHFSVWGNPIEIIVKKSRKTKK